MAGFRNRLIHFYSEVTKNNLDDIERFNEYVKLLLNAPEKYNMRIE